jgi:hypothetical protein
MAIMGMDPYSLRDQFVPFVNDYFICFKLPHSLQMPVEGSTIVSGFRFMQFNQSTD